jgi:hypothetical protein
LTRRIAALPFLVLVVLAAPVVAYAQDVGDVLAYLPPKYIGPAFALWAFAFYIVGPLLKRSRAGRARSLGEYITQDSHRPPPPEKKPAPVRPIVAVLALALAAPALAEDPPPPADPGPAFGGCLTTARFGVVCAGPAASLAVASWKGGELLTGFRLAAGYGASMWADRWYTVGASVQVMRSVSAEDEPATLAVMGSFAKYLHVGVGRGGVVLFALGVGGGG